MEKKEPIEYVPKKSKEAVAKTLIPRPGLIITQCVMFILNFKFDFNMPWWAMWFPSIIYGLFFIVVLLILLIGMVVVISE